MMKIRSRIAVPTALNLVFLLSALILPRLCIAKYEDQAGLDDWYREQLGVVRYAVFHPAGSSAPANVQKRLYVATDGGFVAALNSRSGAVIWRQALPASKLPFQRLLNDGKNIYTVSDRCTHVHAWSASSGVLQWDVVPDSTGSETTEQALGCDLLLLPHSADEDDERTDVALLQGGKIVRLFAGTDGHELWSWEATPEDENTPYSRLVLTQNEDSHQRKVHAIGIAIPSGGKNEKKPLRMLNVVSLDTVDGSVVSRQSLSKSCQEFQVAVLDEGVLVWLDLSDPTVYVYELGSKAQVIDLPIRGIIPSAQALPEAPSLSLGHELQRALILRMGESDYAVMKITKVADYEKKKLDKYSVETVHEFGRPTFRSAAHPVIFSAVGLDAKHGAHVALISSTIEETKATIVSLHTGHISHLSTPPSLNAITLGAPVKAFLQPLMKDGGSAFAYRLLLVSEDDSAVMIGEGHWVREEALGSVEQALFAELPPRPVTAEEAETDSPSSSRNQSLVESLLKTVRTTLIVDTIDDVKTLIKRVKEDVGALVRPFSSKRDRQAPPPLTSDRFGFNKLIIARTKSSKLFALHSDHGQIVWQQFISAEPNGFKRTTPPLKKGEVVDTPLRLKVTDLLLARVHGLPECVVAGLTPSGDSVVVWLNALNGEEIRRATLPNMKFTHVSIAPFTDSSHRPLILVVNEQSEVYVLPESKEHTKLFEEHSSAINFHTVDKDDGAVWGCRVSAISKSKERSPKPVGLCLRSWTVNFPSGERIISTSYPLPNEHVHLAAKVLGDRSILPKFLNPNMLALATESVVQGSKGGLAAGMSNAVTVYIFDTVTGNSIYVSQHAHSKGPVHMTISENVLVYHHFNSADQRHQLTTVELYSSDEEADLPVTLLAARGIFSIKPDSKETSFSSYGLPPARFLTQSYLFPTAIRAMQSSTTARGITPKVLLIGLGQEQLYMLDRRLVESRRPTGQPTAAEQEEGLVPYHPRLPMFGPSIASYNRTIHKLHHIITAPASLESTSHIFAIGVDLFYTRVYPAKAYDMLNEDFSYGLLIFTMTALIAATSIAAYIGKWREFRKQWI